MVKNIVHATEFVWVLDPQEAFLGPVKNGGTIVARVGPGCWGPMITPGFPGGHEITKPIAVDEANIGDAIAIKIRKINVLSLATTSGNDQPQVNHFVGDPSIQPCCPSCKNIRPGTYVDGIGEDSIKCSVCHVSVKPFKVDNSYTILMDAERRVAVTVPASIAQEIANDANGYSALPNNSKQYSANLLARGEIPGLIAPLRPMIGNIGSCPMIKVPASKNAGDVGSSLVGASHDYALDDETDIEKLTDGHMDVNEVVEGSIVIVPVKVPGGGIYLGDVHAMQGDGELAGHTTDVSAEVIMEISVIKGLELQGPIILPLKEDLPKIVRFRSNEDLLKAKLISELYGFDLEEDSLPIQVIGSGKNLNSAVNCGLLRISQLFNIPLAEVKNRCTITGQVDIGRLPGTVQISILIPAEMLKGLGLWAIVAQHYGV
ncbi:MAG: acetamidase [Clostridiaceae bacterium BRH_c20a]|nr:MAG: acetamidase [Clostridiaceae bacterium BRH_c20a]